MTNRVPLPENEDELYQLSKEQLVEIIKTLQENIARLEESLKLDSQISSKPPSTDLIKKSEKRNHNPTPTRQRPNGNRVDNQGTKVKLVRDLDE